MERKNRSVENKEYSVDALYSYLFPFFSKTKKVLLKLILFLMVSAGVMMVDKVWWLNDEGGALYWHKKSCICLRTTFCSISGSL